MGFRHRPNRAADRCTVSGPDCVRCAQPRRHHRERCAAFLPHPKYLLINSSCVQALRRSKTCRSRTNFIVFLGTPHRGSGYANWGEIASNLVRIGLQDSNKRVLATLEVNGEVLDNIHEEFKSIVSEHGIKVHSFQEAHGITGMKGLHDKVRSGSSSYSWWMRMHISPKLH